MWIEIQWILILIIGGADFKCGEYSNDKMLEELSPVIIETTVGVENVTIKLPKPNENDALAYILTQPNGEQHLFNIYVSDLENTYDYILSGDIPKENTDKYRISYKKKINKEETNAHNKIKNKIRIGNKIELILGPVSEEDFGNWAISACYEKDGVETEVFQIISIHIEERIATIPKDTTVVQEHQTFKVRLSRPIDDLRTCQLVAPDSSPDKQFQRDPEYVQSCGFVLNNVAAANAGTWKVIAVGGIVYVGELNVKVLDKKI